MGGIMSGTCSGALHSLPGLVAPQGGDATSLFRSKFALSILLLSYVDQKNTPSAEIEAQKNQKVHETA